MRRDEDLDVSGEGPGRSLGTTWVYGLVAESELGRCHEFSQKPAFELFFRLRLWS